VDSLLRDAAHDADEPLIALAPGSVWGTKRWPGYIELAGALGGDARLVIVGSAADAPLAAEIIRGAGSHGARTIDATGKLSLLASAELIARAAALVTNDSAPLHLASAMGTPTIAVFGPTVPAFGFGPLAPRSAIAEVMGLPCRPCDRHGPQRCPLGHWRCMREITPDRVVTLLRGILGSPQSFAPPA
jgi:heptosyltransferase-2